MAQQASGMLVPSTPEDMRWRQVSRLQIGRRRYLSPSASGGMSIAERMTAANACWPEREPPRLRQLRPPPRRLSRTAAKHFAITRCDVFAYTVQSSGGVTAERPASAAPPASLSMLPSSDIWTLWPCRRPRLISQRVVMVPMESVLSSVHMPFRLDCADIDHPL